jgi:hypothetical protein
MSLLTSWPTRDRRQSLWLSFASTDSGVALRVGTCVIVLGTNIVARVALHPDQKRLVPKAVEEDAQSGASIE